MIQDTDRTALLVGACFMKIPFINTLTRGNMAKNKQKPAGEAPGRYKGYDIEWLRSLGEEHPDHHLVAEFDTKNSKKGGK